MKKRFLFPLVCCLGLLVSGFGIGYSAWSITVEKNAGAITTKSYRIVFSDSTERYSLPPFENLNLDSYFEFPNIPDELFLGWGINAAATVYLSGIHQVNEFRQDIDGNNTLTFYAQFTEEH